MVPVKNTLRSELTEYAQTTQRSYGFARKIAFGNWFLPSRLITFTNCMIMATQKLY